jgi:glycosyltransferase involved in cell wall biosynthesis
VSSSSERSVVLVWAGADWSSEPAGPQLLDLLEHGWDAHLLCDDAHPLLPEELRELPANVLRTRIHPPPLNRRSRSPRAGLVRGAIGAAIRSPGSAARELRGAPDPLARYLRAVLLALEPEVVRLCSPWGTDRFAGVTEALRARTIVSVTGDGAFALAVEEPERLQHSLASAGAVHTESERLAEHLRQAAPGGAELCVISPGHDADLLELGARPDRDGNALHILSVGPLTWHQGYEHALQAVALLAARGVPCAYRIVGRGDFADAVAFARHQLGLERVVEIVPPQDRTALREHLEWADAFVSAAVIERSPRALRDGQAAGLPIVATQPAPPGGEGSLQVPKRDPEALAASLTLLARDPERRRRLGEAGRRAAGAAISVEEQLTRLRDLYGRVLEGGIRR